jgi:signal transduction histidine kinase/CheY-like chemotaxis protein
MRRYGSISRYLQTSAVERVGQIPIRVLLALLLSWTLYSAGRADLIAPWLAISFSVQAYEFLAMSPFRSKRRADLGRPRFVLPAVAAILAMSVVHSALAAIIFMSGGKVEATVAALMLTGGLLNNVASGVESRPIFFIGAGPYMAALLFAPVGMMVEDVTPSIALLGFTILLFAMAVYGVWRRTNAVWTAEKVALAQAQTRLEQAEAAMADRAAMAAIVSHELRTPVSAILAGAHVIRNGGRPEQIPQTAELIIDASRLMAGMLNDLLDHSKIEARAMSLEIRDFELAAFMRDTVRFWSAPAAEKGLALALASGEEAAVWLRGDPYRLRQVVNNLISNAIKFTAEGSVTLELGLDTTSPELRRLRLTVRDQGAGIGPEAMDQLFSPFAQGSAEVARTYGGTGLGLTVSRDLVRLMGGDITVQSAPGQGAAFTVEVELPLGRPTEAPDVLDGPAPDLRPRLKVLAVDDHEINRRTLALVLQPLEVELTTASNGDEALGILAGRAFDVVLMDVNMPGLDGNETTRRLRAGAGPNAATPVIGFSAGAEPAQVQACRAAGMTDWLAKPLEPRKLYAALERATRPAAADEDRSAAA